MPENNYGHVSAFENVRLTEGEAPETEDEDKIPKAPPVTDSSNDDETGDAYAHVDKMLLTTSKVNTFTLELSVFPPRSLCNLP